MIHAAKNEAGVIFYLTDTVGAPKREYRKVLSFILPYLQPTGEGLNRSIRTLYITP